MPTSDTPAELLTRLAEAPPRPYPDSIIKEMIDRMEEMTLPLLEVLTDAAQRPKHYVKAGNWKQVVFASYLLAQFRVTAAFQPLCTLLGGPEEDLDAIFSDMITEDMGNILASVYDGDDRPLRALVENQNAADYVRGCTVTRCYQCMLVEGKITRDVLETYVTELLGGKLERVPGIIWDCWTVFCAELGFASTIPLIQKAIDDDLCDPYYYGFDEILRAASNGDDDDWKKSTGLIQDTVKETSWWANWTETDEQEEGEDDEDEVGDEDEEVDWESYLLDSTMTEPSTVVRDAPKVGRNDPCPCGSEKKFKKCCGAV